jgi:hypothetical protein
MSTTETEESNSRSRKVVGRWSFLGGVAMIAAGWILRAKGKIGFGDTFAIGLSLLLFLVAVNRYAAQGNFGANFGEKGAVRRHWKQVVTFLIFMIGVPLLSSVGKTRHEYFRSVAIINGVFIGASFLLWVIDRKPEVCTHCGSLLVVVEIDENESK